MEIDDPFLAQCYGAIIVLNQVVGLSSPKDLAAEYGYLNERCYASLNQAFGYGNPEFQAFKVALDSLNPLYTAPLPPAPIVPPSDTSKTAQAKAVIAANTGNVCGSITEGEESTLQALLSQVCGGSSVAAKQLKLEKSMHSYSGNVGECASYLSMSPTSSTSSASALSLVCETFNLDIT